MSSVKDGNITHVYEYDSLGRLIRAYQKDNNGTTLLAVENTYDEYGRALGSKYDISGVSQEYGITYKAESSLVSSYSLPNGVTNSYVYDAFERLTSKTAYRHSVSYTYVSGSALVASETVSRYDGGVTNYAYTYNALGYITAISKNGTTVAEYEYDALGQLVCEEYPVDGVAYVYTYDKAGNITGKYEFPYYQGTLAGDYLNYLTQYKVTYNYHYRHI